VRWRYNQSGGANHVPLCNFSARIVSEDSIDDGSGEVYHVFTIRGELADGSPLPAVSVPASEYPGMNWGTEYWGCRAIINAGQGLKDHLRAAIQELSAGAQRRTVYKHTGWRQIGEVWVYLHAGGAIGSAGAVADVTVQLEEPLARFRLPEPPEVSQLVSAVRASLGLLQLGPDRLVYPLLASVYRAVLGPVDYSLHLVGRSGLGKSELCALAQQHFGPTMDRLHLPGNWLSTGNSLSGLASLAQDALLIIDDFKPKGNKADIDRLHALADNVFRGQGNGS
jgi:hypothetical protein